MGQELTDGSREVVLFARWGLGTMNGSISRVHQETLLLRTDINLSCVSTVCLALEDLDTQRNGGQPPAVQIQFTRALNRSPLF
jgi:hypothetical protein